VTSRLLTTVVLAYAVLPATELELSPSRAVVLRLALKVAVVG
jgi:hypothetical protein